MVDIQWKPSCLVHNLGRILRSDPRFACHEHGRGDNTDPINTIQTLDTLGVEAHSEHGCPKSKAQHGRGERNRTSKALAFPQEDFSTDSLGSLGTSWGGLR
jgi:hypothetical protein